ncbi:MAG: alpha/beta fold hydrolase [Solirubrobacteraceae bacterium]
MTAAPELGSVALAHGKLAFARLGSGAPVVLLHQTPRSHEEYREVMPLLAARGHEAIAFDTPGFGDSAPVPGEPSIERWAQAIGDGIQALGLVAPAVVGHHTGGVIAVELCHQLRGQIRAAVLSSTPLTDAAYRATPPDESGVDEGDTAEALRRSRAGFYPADRPELLDRYVADALRAGPLALRGHHVVGSYAMDGKLESLPESVLLIGADQDPHAFPQLERMRAALPRARAVVIRGGMVPLPDGWPEQFATHVADFLATT